MLAPEPRPLAVYAVTRGDLPKSLRGVQCGHAVMGLTFHGSSGASFAQWIFHDEVLVYLRVPGEDELKKLYRRLKDAGITCFAWQEPDCNDEFTAFAVEPRTKQEMRRFFGGLSLA